MNLARSVAEWVLEALPYDRSDPDVVAALQGKNPTELLVLYLNWLHRLVPVRPREVLRSVEFQQNPLSVERSDVISQIVDDIEQGRDLTRYLSRRVQTGFALPSNLNKKKLNQIRHLDLLLNDWQIHHLHLSTSAAADGFVQRDDPLLFVMFRYNKAYFLDIGTHRCFADDRLVQVAVANWPEENLFVPLVGIVPPRGPTWSTAERAQLRAVGITSLVRIGSRIFAQPGGISSAGTSGKVSIYTGRIMRTLNKFEEDVRRDPSQIIELIRQHGGEPREKPVFKFAMFESGYGVIEIQSRALIKLGENLR